MFVALVLMVMGVILFDMRTRLKVMDARVALLEGVKPRPWEPADAAPAAAARVVERATDEAPLKRPSAANPPTAPTEVVNEGLVEQELVSSQPRLRPPNQPAHPA